MNVIIFVQARMSSYRFPGKMLMTVQEKPLVWYVLNRLGVCQESKKVIVATSSDRSDDLLAHWCEDYGIGVFRGELSDVYGRLMAAAGHYMADAFVRICGDSPLIDPDIVDEAVEVFKSQQYDLVTNVFPRSFPKGQSVEVIRSKILSQHAVRVTTADDREHVTSFFYRHAEELRIKNILNPFGSHADSNLCVDTPEDFNRFERIILGMDKPLAHYDWRQCLDLAKAESGEPKR